MQSQQHQTQNSAGGPAQKNRNGVNGRRKGNPGTRGQANRQKAAGARPGQQSAAIRGDKDHQSDDIQAMTLEQPMTQDDQERLSIIEQLQEQIKKKADEATGASIEEDDEIERLLHGYVSMCHNAAMEFMKTNQSRAARRILNQCATYVSQKVPASTADLVARKGIMHTIFNNLAQHANMTADMTLSIEYLEKALEAAEQPQCEQDLLPLAETYLNLANGYSFLNKYEEALDYSSKALRFAKQRCDNLREEIRHERESGPQGPNPKADALEYQLNDFIAIMIMSELCVGEQHEKLGSFNAAIKFYAEGKQVAEDNFGTRHPLYTKCINAMGGARLKSKYQTKEVYRTTGQPGGGVAKTGKTKKVKKVKKAADSTKDSGIVDIKTGEAIQSKLMERRMQQASGSKHKMRRNISGAIRASDVHKSSRRYEQDNLLYANCDSWTSMHCRHTRDTNRQNISHNYQPKKRMVSSGIMSTKRRNRPGSAQLYRSFEERNGQSLMMTREQRLEQKMSHEILDTLTDRKTPYKVVCKIGPSCKNHDWSVRSPIKKVCTRGPNCPNHDWDCSLASSLRSRKSVKSARPASPQPEPVPQAMTEPLKVPTPRQEIVTEIVKQKSETHSDSHSCMVNQNERVHHQQMQHMRSMQEDQFKMLQLVMESQQKNQLQMRQSQQQMAWMYYPHQHYGGAAYYHPNFYHQQAGYQNYYPGYGQQYADEQQSMTETDDMSEVEQVHSGRKPQPSELSKVESKTQFLEQACQQQRQQMADMQQKMSQMQQQFEQQIQDMRASQERIIEQEVRARSASHHSSEQRKFVGKKDQAIDESAELPDLNDRDFGGSDRKATIQSRKESIKMMRDASAQAIFEQAANSVRQSTSILKQSNKNSKVAYQSIVDDHKPSSATSKSRSDASVERSHSRHRSFNKSNRSAAHSSFITEKSFRLPHSLCRMSKREAAIIIQKYYRRFRLQSDFKKIMRRQTQRKLLFKATIRGGDLKKPRILTCSLNMRSRGTIDSLTFAVSQVRNSGSEMIDIDLSGFYIQDATDMKDKVLRIIREALSQNDIGQAIRVCFCSPIARDILESEFYSEEEFSDRVIGHKFAIKQSSSQESLAKQSEEPPKPEIPMAEIPTSSHQKITSEQRRSAIDAEIQRIRQRCDIKYHVTAGTVAIKGHRKETDVVNSSDIDEEIDAELKRHGPVDSEDEKNTRHIQVTTSIGFSAKKRKRNAYEQDSEGADSQHDYEFVIGDGSKPLTIRKTNMASIVKLQARVRGFLIRMKTRAKQKIIYRRILRKEDNLVRFTLLKDPSTLYKLMADVQMKRHLNRSTYLNYIPFEDDEAANEFERCLVFSMNRNEITELDLVGEKANPFVAEKQQQEHLFITDYQPRAATGEHLIKSWMLRDMYPCELFQVVNKEKSMNSYKVQVTYFNRQCYLKLHKLPQDIYYMAYYLNAVLQVQLNNTQQMDYIYMTKLADTREFKRSMDDLERRCFGTTRSSQRRRTSLRRLNEQLPRSNSQSQSPDSSFARRQQNDSQQLAQRDSPASRQNRSDGSMLQSFELDRRPGSSVNYNVEIYHEKGRYLIVVKNTDDQNDRDKIPLQPISERLDEIIAYVQKNLRIYTKNDGSIDYLSLNNDPSMFSAQSKRQFQQRFSGGNVKRESPAPVGRHSASIISRESPSTSSLGYSRQPTVTRVPPTLVDKLEQFMIEQDGIQYKVNVQERGNHEGKPLQVTVTGLDNDNNSRYLVYHNKQNMSDAELISYLKENLHVYVKTDEERSRDYIDYISLQRPMPRKTEPQKIELNNVRSSGNIPTSKNIAQARASRRPDSDTNSSIINTINSTHRVPRYQANRNSSLTQSEDAMAEYEREWEELARHEGDSLVAILISKNENSQDDDQSRRPPKRQSDTTSFDTLYKILVFKSFSRGMQRVGDISLSVAASHRLLTFKASQMDRNSSQMTIEELMQTSPVMHDPSQLELLKQRIIYEKNEFEWQTILENIFYSEIEETIKFDLWNLCQQRENPQPRQQQPATSIQFSSMAISSDGRQTTSIQAPKSVSIQPKLNTHKQRTTTGLTINSAEEYLNSKVDGGDEGTLESVKNADNKPVQHKIMRRSEYNQQMQGSRYNRKWDSPYSNSGQVDFEFDDNGNELPPRQSVCTAIVKTSDSKYYNIKIVAARDSFQLTVMDKNERKQVCNRLLIPADFIKQVPETGQDKLREIKEAIELKIQECGQVRTNPDGQLNIFSGFSAPPVPPLLAPTQMIIDTRGSDVSGSSERRAPPKLQVMRRSTYERQRKEAARRQSDDSYRSSPDQDVSLNEGADKTNPAIIRSKDGTFYIFQIFMQGDDEKLSLSVMNRVTKERICTLQPIPQEFVDAVPNEEFDILEAVKKALLDKFKNTSSIKDMAYGGLNPSLFEL